MQNENGCGVKELTEKQTAKALKKFGLTIETAEQPTSLELEVERRMGRTQKENE